MGNAGIFETWKGWAPLILSLIRIVSAAIFATSGTSKLFAFPAGMPPDNSTAPLMSFIGFGGLLELLGGVLLILGLFTRPTAFVLSGMMAVAYFMFHGNGSFWPTVNGGTPAILFCFLWLYISAAGPGPLSLDAMLARNRAGRH